MNIDYQKFCELCHTSLCDILSGFGSNPGCLSLDYDDEDYKSAKTALIIERDTNTAEGQTADPICYEDVLECIVMRGGRIAFTDVEDDKPTPHYLDKGALERGVDAFIEKCPSAFADYLNENADSITDNLFIQCCLFGEVVYG